MSRLWPASHPTDEQLAELARTLAPYGDARTPDAVDASVREHVHACTACTTRLHALQRTAAAIATGTIAPAPSVGRRDAMLAARSRGDRVILPTAADDATERVRTLSPWVRTAFGVAAAAAVLVASFAWRTPSEVIAGTTAGDLTLSTMYPRAGDTVHLTYRASPMLDRAPALRVRARVRSVHAESYEDGASSVVALTQLRRETDGRWHGRIVLPDSIVFAALAVEDTGGVDIDDHDGRTWELLRADSAGRVMFEALEQRIHDLMGRNWEVAHATSRQLADSFPDDIRTLSWERSFAIWSGLPADSIAARYDARARTFEQRHAAGRTLDPTTIGYLYWTSDRRSPRGRALREQLLRDAPTNSFAIQERLFEALDVLTQSRDTARALSTLDTLYAQAPADRRVQVADQALGLAVAYADTASIRRWTTRTFGASADEERRAAGVFVQHPALRAEGLDRLRRVLRALERPDALPRRLSERADAFARRQALERRRAFAALGRGLAQSGAAAAALDTLTRAADGWDVSIMRAVASTAKTVGDTALEARMLARLALDPAASPAVRDSLRTRLRARPDAEQLQQDAERAFVDAILAEARPRMIARSAPLRALDGAVTDLRDLARNTVTVLVTVSRYCGPAVEVLPAVRSMAAALAADGIRTHVLFEETTVSDSLRAFVTEHTLTIPTYVDPEQAGTRTLNSWGTPGFHILDGNGALVFDATSDPEVATRRALAVRRAARGAVSPRSAP